VTVNATIRRLAGLWPLFGLLIETPRLQLRLPREDELPALARAARDIAGPDGPRLQMPWMYGGSPDMERQLLQRHWRALAHWKPASWHLPLAVFLASRSRGRSASAPPRRQAVSVCGRRISASSSGSSPVVAATSFSLISPSSAARRYRQRRAEIRFSAALRPGCCGGTPRSP
jgi:hypothetical protein